MRDGGKLTIELANVMLDEAYAARHPELSPGIISWWRWRYGDGHAGGYRRPRLDPFFTTQPDGQGSGARPQHGLRLRQAERRTHQDLQRTGTRHERQALLQAKPRRRGGTPSRGDHPP